MNKTRRRPLACLAGLGLALGSLSGCQTWIAGMTLPSGHYLQHPPQYFPPSPPYPLPRELAAQEATAGALAPGLAAPVPGQLPPPVPAVPPGAGAVPPPGAPGVPGPGQLPPPAPAQGAPVPPPP
jgi:hypothetical protein